MTGRDRSSSVWQVETDPIPHLLIDVRTPDIIKEAPLPRELSLTALQIALDDVEPVLAGHPLLSSPPILQATPWALHFAIDSPQADSNVQTRGRIIPCSL